MLRGKLGLIIEGLRLAKKATKCSIVAVSRAASDEGASSTASGIQQQASRCRPIHNLWWSR